MTRNFSILAAAATVALLAFSAGEASAMNLGNRGGQPGGGPNGPGPTASSGNSGDVYLRRGCNNRVDLTGLSGEARRDFVWRCGPQTQGF